MSEVIVYGVPGSPYVRAALLGFEEKGAPYHLHALGLGEEKTPAHLVRHPFAAFPPSITTDLRFTKRRRSFAMSTRRSRALRCSRAMRGRPRA